MKRIHLFEFEDLPWFPHSLRQMMTLYLVSFHRLLKTSGMFANFQSPDYHWEIGGLKKKGYPGAMQYLLGLPMAA